MSETTTALVLTGLIWFVAIEPASVQAQNTSKWTNADGGEWNDAANWLNGVIPSGPADQAIFEDLSGQVVKPYRATVADELTLAKLQVNAPSAQVFVDGANLFVGDEVHVSRGGSVFLNGGALIGATLTTSDQFMLVANDAVLNTVSLAGDAQIEGSLEVKNGLKLLNRSRVEVEKARIRILDGGRLSGDGSVRLVAPLTDSTTAQLHIDGTGYTIGREMTFRVGDPMKKDVNATLDLSGTEWTHEGRTILDNGNIHLSGQNWNHVGPIIQTGGTLRFSGEYTSDQFDRVVRLGGFTRAEGTVLNQDRTLYLSEQTGDWAFDATIGGGNLAVRHGARVLVPPSGDLALRDVQQLEGEIHAMVAADVVVDGNLELQDGAFVLASRQDISDPTSLTLRGNLSGTGAIAFVGPGNTNRLLGRNVELGPGIVVRTDSGGGSLGDGPASQFTSRGDVIASSFPVEVEATLDNQGNVSATGGGTIRFLTRPANLIDGKLSGGTWSVSTGEIKFEFPSPQITTNAATIELTGREASFLALGQLRRNEGTISVARGHRFTSASSFSNAGQLHLDDATMSFGEDFEQIETGLLEITLHRPIRGAAMIQADGSITLLGSVGIKADPLYTPTAGDYFSLFDSDRLNIDATLSLSGLVAPFGWDTKLFDSNGILAVVDLNGDFNVDGEVDLLDVELIEAAIKSGQADPAFDLTGDGTVSSADLFDLVEHRFGTLKGDANFDRRVGFDDFLALTNSFGKPSDWSNGDFNGSRTTDFSDFLVLSSNFGLGVSEVPTSIRSVPEPISLPATCLAFITLMVFWRRRASLLLPASAFCLLFAVGTVNGQVGTWSSPVGGNWEDATNWQDATVPNGAGAVATIPINRPDTNAQVSINSNVTIGEFQFGNANAVTIDGAGELLLGNAGRNPRLEMSSPTGYLNLTVPIRFVDRLDIVLHETAKLDLSSLGTGSGDVDKSGRGVLTLTGDSSEYTGRLVVSEGNVHVGTAEALGGSIANRPTHIKAGGAIIVAPALTIDAETFEVEGGSLLGPANGTAVIQSNVNLVQTSILGSQNIGGQLLIDGEVGGPGGLMIHRGRVSLTSSNNYAGITVVQGGSLIVEHPSALGDSIQGTEVRGGALSIRWAGTEPLAVRSGVLTLDSPNAVQVGELQVFGGTAAINSGLSAPVTVSGGELQVNTRELVAPLSLHGGSLRFQLGQDDFPNDILYTGGLVKGSATLSGNIALKDGVQAEFLNQGGQINISGNVSGRGDVIFSGLSSSLITGGLNHDGTLILRNGEKVLKSANSYTGFTIVAANTFVEHPDALGLTSEGTFVTEGTLNIFASGVKEPILVEAGADVLLREADHPGPVTLAGGDLVGFVSDGVATYSGGVIIERSGRIESFNNFPLEVRGIRGIGTATVSGQVSITDAISNDVDLFVTGNDRRRVSIDSPQDHRGVVAVGYGSPLVVNVDSYFDELRLEEQAELITASDAVVRLNKFDPQGAVLDANIAGLESIVLQGKRTSFRSLGADFEGAISVEGGLLQVVGDQGLGSSVGTTSVATKNAAIALGEGAQIRESIFLDNASGYLERGAVVAVFANRTRSTGIINGDLHLGSDGAFLGEVTLNGRILGGSLTKAESAGVLQITSGNHQFSGPISIRNGAIRLDDQGSVPSTTEIHVNGKQSVLDVATGAVRRIPSNVPVVLHGGTLQSSPSQNTGNGASRTQSIARVHVTSGRSLLASRRESGLRIGSLTRDHGSVVSFEVDTTDAGLGVRLDNLQLNDGLIGGWALVDDRIFATQTVRGIQPYSGFTSQVGNATQASNIWLREEETLTQDVAINALQLSPSSTRRDPVFLDLGTSSLTVDTGGISSFDAVNEIRNGRLTSGGDELFLHGSLALDATVVDRDESPLNVIVAHGEVEYRVPQMYSGTTTVVSTGELIASPNTIPSDATLVLNGGLVRLHPDSRDVVTLGRLRLDDRGEIQTGFETSGIVLVEAGELDVRSGTFNLPLTGETPLNKTTYGVAYLSRGSPTYSGSINVTDGILVAKNEVALGTGTTTVAPGGALATGIATRNSRGAALGNVVLAGGSLTAAVESAVVFPWPAHVEENSTIISFEVDDLNGIEDAFLTLAGNLTGSANLEIVHPGNGSVLLAGDNRGFAGDIIVRNGALSTQNRYGLGGGRVLLSPNATLSFDDSRRLFEGTIVANGGFIDSFRNDRFQGELIVETTIKIEPRTQFDLRGSVTLADQSTVRSGSRESPPGVLRFTGDLYVDGNATIVTEGGKTELTGTIRPRALDSTLELRNAQDGDSQFDAHVAIPGDHRLRVSVENEPRLRFDLGASVGGSGTLSSDVLVTQRGELDPGDNGRVGTLFLNGNLGVGELAEYHWQIQQTENEETQPPGWDQIAVSDAVSFTTSVTGPFRVVLSGVDDSGDLAAVPDFDRLQSYQWTILTAASFDGFDSNHVEIATLPFTLRNPVAPDGRFSLSATDKELVLEYGFTVDFDDSGRLDVGDISMLCDALGTGDLLFDLNADGNVDASDLSTLINSRFGIAFGDANLDGQVAFDDFLKLSARFGGFGNWNEGDFDCSGDIAFADFLLLSHNFGSSSVVAQTVPEPSANLAQLTLAIFALLRVSLQRGSVRQ